MLAAHTVLAGPDGEVSAELHPLFVALTTVTNPATMVTWLGKSRSAQLLGSLARTGDPVTHDLLDNLPQTQALHYVREMLVSSGVLPARNEHLERLAPWLEHLLHDKPAHQARLIRPFAHWFVLRDERIRAGVFARLEQIALEACDRIFGLLLRDLAVDGCITKAPGGGQCAGGLGGTPSIPPAVRSHEYRQIAHASIGRSPAL